MAQGAQPASSPAFLQSWLLLKASCHAGVGKGDELFPLLTSQLHCFRRATHVEEEVDLTRQTCRQ